MDTILFLISNKENSFLMPLQELIWLINVFFQRSCLQGLTKANFVTGMSVLMPTLGDTITTELHNLNVLCLYP